MTTATAIAEQAPLRFESFAQLKDRGIPYCREHVARLVKAGKFPAPISLSDSEHGGSVRIAWLSSELDTWMLKRAAARGGAE